MATDESSKEIRRALRKNAELLEENNRLLRKLHRLHIISALFKVLWIVVLIGLPFALYFYVLEPYFQAFGSSYETFRTGLNELPGLKGIDLLFEDTFGGEEGE